MDQGIEKKYKMGKLKTRSSERILISEKGKMQVDDRMKRAAAANARKKISETICAFDNLVSDSSDGTDTAEEEFEVVRAMKGTKRVTESSMSRPSTKRLKKDSRDMDPVLTPSEKVG